MANSIVALAFRPKSDEDGWHSEGMLRGTWN